MAIGSILAAAAPAVISAGASALFNRGGGGSSQAPAAAATPSVRSGALNVRSFGRGGLRGLDVSLGGDFQRSLRGFQSANLARADELRGFLPQLAPGFGALTEARVNAVRNRRSQVLGGLRAEAARRRIAGSSFAQNQLTRAESEFAEAEANARATSFLEELNATLGIIDNASQASIASAGAALDAMQFEASIAAQLQSGVATNQTSIAQTNAQIAAENAQLNAAGLGTALAPIGEAVGSFLGNLGNVTNSGTILPPGQVATGPGGG